MTKNYIYYFLILFILIFLFLIIRMIPQFLSCLSLFNKYIGIHPCNECCERLNIFKNLETTDIVLEIGGNIGSSSLVIADRISNPSKNFVVVEPSRNAIEELKRNQQRNNLKFNIFQGIIGTKSMYATEYGYFKYVKLSNTKLPSSYEVPALTIKEIQKKFGINFNTLVIDCEGCYETLFDSKFLANFNKIFIEWDGKFLEKWLLKNGFKKIDHWKHGTLIHGISYYRRI